MGKVKIIRVDDQGNFVKGKDKPDTEVIQFDVTTKTLKKEKPKKKSMVGQPGRAYGKNS
jgi:hypothetical protein